MKKSWHLWEQIASRITGISFPIFGVSWNPPVLERTVAERAITYLETRGLLYTEFQWENPDRCYEDADVMRAGVTSHMLELNRREASVHFQLDVLRDACRIFRDILREQGLHRVTYYADLTDIQRANFLQALGAFRDTCGKQIMIFAVKYGIDVAEHLAVCLSDPELAD